MVKKKILYISDSALSKTGFGRVAKDLLLYLQNTEKYEIVQYCCGHSWSHPDLKKLPWKAFGTLPDSQAELNKLNSDPNRARLANYGEYNLDKIVEQEKPSFILIVNDIWGIDFACNKHWFNKVNSILWTTLDSQPILPSAIQAAKKSKNFWVWSDFARKDLHKLDLTHVKTIPGCINPKSFFPLNLNQKSKLRLQQKIDTNCFIAGYVFRNQLRKSVPNLLSGYRKWKDKSGVTNCKVLLHTCWSENPAKSWDIPRLIQQNGLSREEVVTTYICKQCKNYRIKPFVGENQNCEYCKTEKSQITCNTRFGVTEEQLNEIYNLMDIFLGCYTSGGQELTQIESKLCGIIDCSTNYSCGEDYCNDPLSETIPLDFSVYQEISTNFIKASTDTNSIAKAINKVYEMPIKKRIEKGLRSRKWALEKYSPGVIGKIMEQELDSMPEIDYDFKPVDQKKNPDAQIENYRYNREWLIELYKKILKADVDDNDPGHKYWMKELGQGKPKEAVEAYFRQVALNDNKKLEQKTFEDYLGDEGQENRILIIIPESIGDVFLCTSLFRSAKEQYPDCKLYVATKGSMKNVLDGNPYVDSIIPYIPEMDSQIWLEGQGEHKGYFKCAFLPYWATQRHFLKHHRQDNIAFDIKYA